MRYYATPDDALANAPDDATDDFWNGVADILEHPENENEASMTYHYAYSPGQWGYTEGGQ